MRERVAALVGLAVVAVTSVLGATWWLAVRPVTVESTVAVAYAPVSGARTLDRLQAELPANSWSVDAYNGLGAWVDGFDYSPAYANGGVPPLVPAAVNEMAEAGVQTIYLQSGRLDERSPDLLEDQWIIAEFLLRAHQHDMKIVAWYLPKWTDPEADLAHLRAAADFSFLGHQFDGLAVDIEWNEDDLTSAERNQYMIELSAAIDTHVGGAPLGAIVLPPVQTEVINTAFWPDFAWTDIAGIYDVWLPMSYWSFRTAPYGDGYNYNAESTRRLRANVGDPDALVHAIGGIGAQRNSAPSGTEPFIADIDDLEPFVQSLIDTNAVGGSIYDWMTTDESGRQTLRSLMSSVSWPQ